MIPLESTNEALFVVSRIFRNVQMLDQHAVIIDLLAASHDCGFELLDLIWILLCF